MPTYEYECPRCGVFEVFQGMKEERLKTCPTCKRKVRRLLGTGAGVIFKGSGFYQTDYRGAGYASAAKADTEKAETKTEAKAEAKPEPAKPDKPPKKTEKKKT